MAVHTGDSASMLPGVPDGRGQPRGGRTAARMGRRQPPVPAPGWRGPRRAAGRPRLRRGAFTLRAGRAFSLDNPGVRQATYPLPVSHPRLARVLIAGLSDFPVPLPKNPTPALSGRQDAVFPKYGPLPGLHLMIRNSGEWYGIRIPRASSSGSETRAQKSRWVRRARTPAVFVLLFGPEAP
jgi:hypothetical protein